jgi:hypothetical protein
MQSAGFEPAIPAIERPQTNTLYRTVTDIGLIVSYFGEFRDINYYNEICL